MDRAQIGTLQRQVAALQEENTQIDAMAARLALLELQAHASGQALPVSPSH
jgi:hypothetical protein